MLSDDGHVCEGSAENIFIVRKGEIITPPPSDNILEGITRAKVMHLVREELGLEVRERSIDRSELYVADEVFLVGTGAQVAPVIEIDRRRVGDGEPGPLTNRVQDTYLKVVTGRDPEIRRLADPDLLTGAIRPPAHDPLILGRAGGARAVEIQSAAWSSAKP